MRGRSQSGWSRGRCSPWLRRRGALIGVLWGLGSAIALTGFGGAAAAAGAGAGGPSAFGVRSASLVQDGQRLRWRVALDHDFSGAAFAHHRRTLCLLIDHRRSRAATGQLCVAPPRSAHGRMRLTFARVTRAGAGRPVAVPATISRGGRDELTAVFAPVSLDPRYRSLHWQVRSTRTAAACSTAGASSGQASTGAGTTGGQSPTAGQTTTAGSSTTTAGSSTTTAGSSTATTGSSTTTGSGPAPKSHCTIVFPSRPRLARLHTPRLVGCVAAGSSLVFSGPSRRHEIALTFDDGPWGTPPTMDFINLLARYHVPATFFEIGSQISEYDPTGAIERKMLADGDMIGDHTWTHPDMTKLSPAAQTSQLQMTAGAIHHATGFTPCLWRPPYGAIDNPLVSLARGLGMLTIYWNVDTRDWSLPGVGAIEQSALSGASNGGIILMHFGGGPRYETYDALPTIIDTLRRRGYQFVNVAQLLGLRMIYR